MRGAHQFQVPSTRMVAGTSSERISVASIRMASASPSPTALTRIKFVKANEPATTTRISAALVMMRPVRASPCSTARALSPVAQYSSRMRASRKTS